MPPLARIAATDEAIRSIPGSPEVRCAVIHLRPNGQGGGDPRIEANKRSNRDARSSLHLVDVQAGIDCRLEVLEAVRDGEGQLQLAVRARFLHMVAAHAYAGGEAHRESRDPPRVLMFATRYNPHPHQHDALAEGGAPPQPCEKPESFSPGGRGSEAWRVLSEGRCLEDRWGRGVLAPRTHRTAEHVELFPVPWWPSTATAGVSRCNHSSTSMQKRDTSH